MIDRDDEHSLQDSNGLLKVEGSNEPVILSEAKDLLKRIEHRKTRSFASLRMTWAQLCMRGVVHYHFHGSPCRCPARDDTAGERN